MKKTRVFFQFLVLVHTLAGRRVCSNTTGYVVDHNGLKTGRDVLHSSYVNLSGKAGGTVSPPFFVLIVYIRKSNLYRLLSSL